MTYACPWEFMADTHLMKLQHLQNGVPCTIGKFPRSTLIRDMHMVFQILYVYSYITKLCGQQAQVIQGNENANVRSIGKAKPDTENIRGLNLAVVRHYDCPSD
jgi:hypothetical protein